MKRDSDYRSKFISDYRSKFINDAIDGARILIKPHIALNSSSSSFVFFGRSFANKDRWTITDRFVLKLNCARAKS